MYPGNTNFQNSHPLSEQAMGYAGFHCINVSAIQCASVDKLSSFNTPFMLECSFNFLFRAHVGFFITQLKTLSIRRGAQGNNNTLITGLDVATCGVANATGFGVLATNFSLLVASLATAISSCYFILFSFLSMTE